MTLWVRQTLSVFFAASKGLAERFHYSKNVCWPIAPTRRGKEKETRIECPHFYPPIWPVNAWKPALRTPLSSPCFYTFMLTRSVAQGAVSRKPQLFIQS
jgi:hypothetical protein